jgi:twitching motility protein PilT
MRSTRRPDRITRTGCAMIDIFKAAVQRGASDIHIKVGDFLRARIHGDLVPLTQQRLSAEQVRQICLQLITNIRDRERFDELTDYDCSWGAPGLGRFRVNILRQRGTPMAVMRVIPIDIPSFVLVTGVTGSGKSSTLAAMVGYINNTRRRHIITLENPIEFLHRDINCSITQREVGSDTATFDLGLKSALREDPDVVMIGEMRDITTIDTAMKAAETGHLVLSTLHTTNAVQTITRIIAVFPPHEQELVRIRMAETLVGVISQRLLPRKDGRGRVVAAEVMVVTGTIQDAILRGGDNQHEIFDLMADGKDQYGSQTFDQHLRDLVEADLVSYEVAKAAANNPADFELKMRTLV